VDGACRWTQVRAPGTAPVCDLPPQRHRPETPNVRRLRLRFPRVYGSRVVTGTVSRSADPEATERYSGSARPGASGAASRPPLSVLHTPAPASRCALLPKALGLVLDATGDRQCLWRDPRRDTVLGQPPLWRSRMLSGWRRSFPCRCLRGGLNVRHPPHPPLCAVGPLNHTGQGNLGPGRRGGGGGSGATRTRAHRGAPLAGIIGRMAT